MKKNYKKILCIIMSCSIIMSNLCIFANTALAEESKETNSNSYLVYSKDEKEYNKILDKYEKYVSDESDDLQYLKENNIVNLQLNDYQIKAIKKLDDTVKVEEDVVLTGSETAYEAATKSIEQWNLDVIGADEVDAIAGDSHAKIAIIDTGVSASEEIPIAGRVNLVPGEEDIEPLFEDASGHGTSIASIINACENNIGITGINPNAELYSVRALDDGKSAPLSRIIEGIYWCIDNDINIINMSFGTQYNSALLHKAVIDAKNAGILMIAAAGNSGNNGVEYPAAYEEVVAVGSIDSNANVSDFSAVGDAVEIVAPGEDIAATGFFDEVVAVDGTSISAAQVTGIASLLWDIDINKSADFIRALLNDSAKPLNDNGSFGNGVVDLSYAVEHYDEYEEAYSISTLDGEPEILYNNNEVETYTDNEVKALWSSSGHTAALDSTSYSNDKKILLKYAVKMSDHILRGIINNSLGYDWSDTASSVPVNANHYFHGYGNYVANYIFLANSAYYYNSYGSIPASDSSWQSLFPTTVNQEFTYLKNGLTYLNSNWSTVYSQLAADSLSSGLSKTITASTGHNSLIMIGIAIHCAMDAYAHSTVVNGVHLTGTDADNTSNCTARYSTAKAVALAILSKWDAGAGSFQLSEFYQTSTHTAGTFYMQNLLQNVLAVKPNLYSLSSTKYNWFAARNA